MAITLDQQSGKRNHQNHCIENQPGLIPIEVGDQRKIADKTRMWISPANPHFHQLERQHGDEQSDARFPSNSIGYRISTIPTVPSVIRNSSNLPGRSAALFTARVRYTTNTKKNALIRLSIFSTCGSAVSVSKTSSKYCCNLESGEVRLSSRSPEQRNAH